MSEHFHDKMFFKNKNMLLMGILFKENFKDYPIQQHFQG